MTEDHDDAAIRRSLSAQCLQEYVQLHRQGISSVHGHFSPRSPSYCGSLDRIFNINATTGDSHDDRWLVPGSLSSSSIGSLELLSSFDEKTAISINPTAVKHIRALKWTMIRQTLFSILRNIACYAVVVCVLIIAIEGEVFVKDYKHTARLSVLVIIGIGMVGMGFQAVHVCAEFAAKYPGPTVLAAVLQHRVVSRQQFDELITARKEHAPYLGAEVRWRHHARRISSEPDINDNQPSTITRNKNSGIPRKTNQILSIRAWADGSAPVKDLDWFASDNSVWIVVTKDYRATSQTTAQSLTDEVTQFKRSSGYELNRKKMRFDYILDTQQGDTFPDAEAFLVYPSEKRPMFYRPGVYRTFLCLCLDGLYILLFHCITRHATDYNIVKYIER